MTAPRALILGLEGPVLKDDERRLFAKADPLGFILFKRNCVDPAQLEALVQSLRDSVGRATAPVLIDQEGGRVTRLGPPHWRQFPPAAQFAKLAGMDLAAAGEATRLNARLLAAELSDAGIDVDCAPVLDVPVPGAHDVIGDRAFGREPNQVATLGRAQAEGLLEGGVLPVIKHIPGHGRATADTHLSLPVVTAGKAELERSDFAPFRALADMPWAMTAHVVYAAIDDQAPATTSRTVIERVIRGHIGFDGLLLSDDLSMQALRGTIGERAAAALGAGCDVALHCNGKMDEMLQAIEGTGTMTEAALSRFDRGRALLRPPGPLNPAKVEGRIAALLVGAKGPPIAAQDHRPERPLGYA
jgi:beta-N-acetylhexosaminidase